MELISFKLTVVLRRRLAEEARRRRVSQSTVIRESLETSLLERGGEQGKLTCADLAQDLIASVRGPRDLSTSRGYLQQEILRDAGRGKKRRR